MHFSLYFGSLGLKIDNNVWRTMIVLNPKAYENDLLTLAEEIREEIIVIELIRCEDGKYFLYHNVRLSQGQLN